MSLARRSPIWRLKTNRRTGSSPPRQGKYERRDINFISKKILASYQPLLHGATPNAVMVRYEAIASDPKASLKAATPGLR